MSGSRTIKLRTPTPATVFANVWSLRLIYSVNPSGNVTDVLGDLVSGPDGFDPLFASDLVTSEDLRREESRWSESTEREVPRGHRDWVDDGV